MRNTETLAAWIGHEASRRFRKIPRHDMPAQLDWVMYVTGCDDAHLTDEIEHILTVMSHGTGTLPYGEFRHATVYHEARRRHHEHGHRDDCIADTAYSVAVKRVNNSSALSAPCECGGVALPDDWENLRKLFITANWTATIHTLPGGAWMDLHRDHDGKRLRMAAHRPNDPTREPRSCAYDPSRDAWLTLTQEAQITLAWQAPSHFQAAVTAIPGTRSVPAPPYVHALSTNPMNLPGIGRRRIVNGHAVTPRPLMNLDALIPVAMDLLTKQEKGSVKSLLSASGEAYLQAVLVWLRRDQPDPRVFLCEELIHRTCAALGHLPNWYGKLPKSARPTETMRKRRTAMLNSVMDVLGLSEPLLWPTSPPTPEPEPAVTVFLEPAPPEPEPEPAPENDDAPATGKRMDACRILAGMFPEEYETLRETYAEKAALLKLKERHYNLFNRIRADLLAGHTVSTIIDTVAAGQGA